MKFILAGHGQYPKAVLNTLTLFLGEREDIYIVSEDCETDEYKHTIDQLINNYEKEGMLVFTDFLEGSINQYFMRKLRNHQFYLITGFNLAVLLENLLQHEFTKQKIIETIEMAKKEIVYMNDLF